MTKDEALKLALDAMQRIDAFLIRRGYSGLTPQEEEVIAAIEAALAQPTSGDYALGYAEGFNDACKPAQRTWVGSGDLEDSNAYQTPPAQPAPAQTDSFQFDIDEDVQLLMDRDMGDN
jgi:hypothetical protein